MIKIYKYGEVSNDEVFARSEAKVDVEAIVAAIIENVKANGDAALREYSEKFDKVSLESIEVSQKEIEAAYEMKVAGIVFMHIATAEYLVFHESTPLGWIH